MEKDRTRRYASASEFAADLCRHLADEPIVARPAGVAYRGWKFVRRHRVGVAVGAAALLLLLASGATLAIQSRRVAAERDLAAQERDHAAATAAFLVSLFEASDPDRSKERRSARVSSSIWAVSGSTRSLEASHRHAPCFSTPSAASIERSI